MDGFDPEEAALAVTDALRAAGTADRAAQEKRYLKSELEFFGVTAPEMRRVVTAAVRAHPGLERPRRSPGPRSCGGRRCTNVE